MGLEHYSYRRTDVGIDWRGVTKDGKHWRYLGAPSMFEIYDYETDSKEAADLFDKILDGVCFQSNNRPEDYDAYNKSLDASGGSVFRN